MNRSRGEQRAQNFQRIPSSQSSEASIHRVVAEAHVHPLVVAAAEAQDPEAVAAELQEAEEDTDRKLISLIQKQRPGNIPGLCFFASADTGFLY